MKLTKQALKRIIKEEIMKEIKSFPDQDKVYLKFRMGRNMADLPTGPDYYVEVPTIFTAGGSSTDSQMTRHGSTRRTAGWNGLTREGVAYFKEFQDGKFKGLSDNITWKAVDKGELPQIIELAHDPVPSGLDTAEEEIRSISDIWTGEDDE